MFIFNENSITFLILLRAINYSYGATLSTENCGVDYGCYREPENCQNSNCLYIYKYKNDGENIKFEISGKTSDSTASWLSIAFSNDQAMGQDSVVMCKYNPSGQNSVEQYYSVSTPSKNVRMLDPDNLSIGITEEEIKVEDSFFYCSFKRKKAVPGYEFYFDLSNSYYLFASFGKLNAASVPQYHGGNKVISSVKIDFAKTLDTSGSAGAPVKAKAHACLMVVAWILLASNAIVFARYYRLILPNFQPCGIKVWFHIHRTFMVLSLVLNICALFVILSESSWNWVTSGPTVAFAHSIIGIFAIIFTVAQVIVGILRPDLKSEKRHIFNYVHRSFGVFTYLLAIIAIFLGTFIEKMKIETVGWRILIGWLVWLTYLIIQLELIDYFHKRATKDNLAASFELKSNRVDPSPSTPSQQSGTQQNYTEKTVTLMKTIVLFVHIFVSLIISIALILYITIPRTATNK